MISPPNRLKRKCVLHSPPSKRMRHSDSTSSSIQHATTTQPTKTAGHISRRAILGNNTGEVPSGVSGSSDRFLSLPIARQPLGFCDDFASGHDFIVEPPHSTWTQPPVYATLAEHHSLWANPETAHRPLGPQANIITSGSESPAISASSTACIPRSDTEELRAVPSHLIQRGLARDKALAPKLEGINLQSNVKVDPSLNKVSSLLPASAATQTTLVAAMQDRLDHAIIQNKADLFLAGLGLASAEELSRLKKGIIERNTFISQLAEEIRAQLQASSAQLRDFSAVATKWPETEFPMCIMMSDDG